MDIGIDNPTVHIAKKQLYIDSNKCVTYKMYNGIYMYMN